MTRRTPIKLIERAVSEKWIKQLAFYHLLKFRFNNSCIYNYRSRMDELASQLNISTKTLYNYLNLLRSKDMICDHANNLKLKSIRDFKISRKKSVLLISDKHKLFDVTCLLYGKLIEQKAKQQAFAESVRRFGRGDRFKSGLCENPFRPSLSYRTIAKLLNISESKAFRVIHNLNRLDVIRIVKQKPQLISKSFSALNYIEDMPGYRFNIGNRLFEQYGNRIDFLQYPIFLKNITIRQYIKQIHNHL
jgi:hypothetical protein